MDRHSSAGASRRAFNIQLAFLLAISFGVQVKAVYYPLREYSGKRFFDRWEFIGYFDDTTWGNVTYVTQEEAISQHLAYVNSAGNAIMRVDNETHIAPAPFVRRNSIGITSKDTYGAGNIIMIDAIHMPYGCSVWPAFWTRGTDITTWPDGGEIDIIEGINLMTSNSYALHTTSGCFLDPNTDQTGRSIITTNCNDTMTNSGCAVTETKNNSFGAGFAKAGGGVFALQLDISGIYIWFWSRPDIPASIKSATSNSTIDPSTWGNPSAAYPSTTCNYTQYFSPQQILFTIDLCGTWAGIPSIYDETCPGTSNNSCVNDNIIGPGHPMYDNAYWEVSYVRTYIAANSQPGAPGSFGSVIAPTGSGTPLSPSATTTSNSQPNETSSAVVLLGTLRRDLALMFVTLICAMMVMVVY